MNTQSTLLYHKTIVFLAKGDLVDQRYFSDLCSFLFYSPPYKSIFRLQLEANPLEIG